MRHRAGQPALLPEPLDGLVRGDVIPSEITLMATRCAWASSSASKTVPIPPEPSFRSDGIRRSGREIILGDAHLCSARADRYFHRLGQEVQGMRARFVPDRCRSGALSVQGQSVIRPLFRSARGDPQ